ncbi:MAG: AmmeMemoRadiSam system protein B [Candidatus Woesearchaeota archaeon]
MREHKLSGIYYPAARTLIDNKIKEVFMHERGPGDLPAKPNNRTHVKGAIVPIHKYEIAGPCAAWAYKQIAEEKMPDVFIIIGQSTKEESGIGMEPYETPYGIVRVDQALARDIIKKENIKHREDIFEDDEFIESQLPFIQYIHSFYLEKIKIIPIIVGHDVELKKLAVDIKEILLEQNKTATIIVPTNFTKYGANYSYIPFEKDAHKKVYELDAGAIELIKENKPLDYLKYVDDRAMNTNNYLGITLLMLILKPRKSLLEQYYTTADLDGNDKNFTSFASIIFK